jgi:hypothetical protein
MKEEFAGHLSRVVWDGTDVQLQTEIRYKPEPKALVIFVADGVVVSRVEKAWQRSENATREHNRIREFHERLTAAMKRLRDKAYIEQSELKKVAVRLVSAAMQVEQGPRNRAEDALSLIPGSLWVALASKEDGAIEEAPAGKDHAKWIPHLLNTVKITGQLSALFETDELSDICLKTDDGFVIIGEHEKEILVALTETETMPVARQMVSRLQKTLLR